MNRDEFWNLIALHGVGKDPSGAFVRALEGLDGFELSSFQRHVEETDSDLHVEPVAMLCSLLNNGYFTDDGFAACRAWVIAHGRKAYHDALAEPDELLRFQDELKGFAPAQNEALFNLAYEVYKKKFGNEMVVPRTGMPAFDVGVQIDPLSVEFADDARRRMPGLWSFYEGRTKISDL